MVGVEEAVLKRVYWRNGTILLVSENPGYEPMVARPEDVRIVGKVKRVELEPK
jgi:repressor LexA